ncbi:glycosyltransferase family 2 protein [Microbacterium sp. NPDC090007]|uniref:glycosyltransferase family 2 protein n=1 Tax=Microbacterium sp. NPDC090007 TaxID=3364204 RepID=UPI003820B6EF
MTTSIDVMLPYYGDVTLMKLAAQSVLDQTYEHFRLVVIDDGYPDPEPRRWFESMNDPRVSYLRNETNLGANGNYRRAVDLVEADWFVMMGADDVMRSDFLSQVAGAIRTHEVDIIQPAVDVIDENGVVYTPLGDRVKRFLAPDTSSGSVRMGGESLARSLLRGNWAYFPSLAWRTEKVRSIGFRDGFDVVQDLALILDIVATGGHMAVLPDVVFEYRRHSASDSSVRALDGRRFDEERRFFRGEQERFAALGWPRAARAAKLHVTSRLNAASMLPKALKAQGATGALLRHVIS